VGGKVLCPRTQHDKKALALTTALIGYGEKKIQTILRLHKVNKVEKEGERTSLKKM